MVILAIKPKHTTTMKVTTQESQAEQARRLAAKTQDQRMVNEVVSGNGMSPWEAQVVVEVIREVYFTTPGGAPLRHGQLLYTCMKIEAGAGTALKDCPMTSITLSLLGEGDDQVYGAEMLRRHRIGRLCEEARDQGGLLTQEDLGQVLSFDARTIRRDIKALKDLGVHIPARGQQKDIGPTLTHKGVAIRHWLEGKEPQEVARAIDHPLRAVERYLNHFARVIYCIRHGFSMLQWARKRCGRRLIRNENHPKPPVLPHLRCCPGRFAAAGWQCRPLALAKGQGGALHLHLARRWHGANRHL